MSAFAHDASRRIRVEADALQTLRPTPPLRFSRSRGRINSREAYEVALSLPDAAHALALLRTYAELANLDQDEAWAVSALPTTNETSDRCRFATINFGSVEGFYVWFSTRTGTVDVWGLRVEGEVSAPAGARFELHKGDTYFAGRTLEDLLRLLDDPTIATAVRATRDRRRFKRRLDWHNPYLAAYVCPRSASGRTPVEPEPGLDAEEAMERRYIEVVVRKRLHQAPLREKALRHYPNECAYCGIDVLELLDCAHLEADSEGGEASLKNVRLLCVNHHRALDTGLLLWADPVFVPAPGAPPLPPLPRGPQQ